MSKRSSGLMLALVLVICSCAQQRYDALRSYIHENWDATVRVNPSDEGTLLGLPYPYTVPCTEGTFQEMYYWDTFFTNEGLVRDGHLEQALFNTENVMAMVERFSFMPNGTRTWYVNRSQPPYLAFMVESVYECTHDNEWLSRAYDVISKEYAFWMNERIAPCGLNHYDSAASDELALEFVGTASKRLGYEVAQGCNDAETLAIGRHFAAEAESGWDFSPRFQGRCMDFCPVDLNANLYHYERLMAEYSKVLGRGEDALWNERAERRISLVNRYMRDESGMYFDYDYVNDTRSDVISAAVFNLLMVHALTRDEALALADAALSSLEFDHGLAMCADRPYRTMYQWSFPNAWAPGAYIAVRGLDSYGRHSDARRIARKYLDSMNEIYAQTGTLWEKYNAQTGSTDVVNEYEMPQMMGWSAGVCLYCYDYITK